MTRGALTTGLVASLITLPSVGCSDGTEPDVEYQVIEETEFDPSLGIVLSEMSVTPSGVYYEDIVVGTGEAISNGMRVRTEVMGQISSGVVFSAPHNEDLIVGNPDYIVGLSHGVVGMQVGGTRRMLVPPELGFGDQSYGYAPAGSILILRVEVLEVL